MKKTTDNGKVRRFPSGATRGTSLLKLDYEGFLSPIVLERFAQYMHGHRIQADGKLRSSSNWQKGITKDSYMKSLLRHTFEVWKAHRGGKVENLQDSLCGVIFNSMGYLFEDLNSPPKMKETTRSTWERAVKFWKAQDELSQRKRV